MSIYKVWVEIECEEDDGSTTDASFYLNGASVATFDNLADATHFGNTLQDYGQEMASRP